MALSELNYTGSGSVISISVLDYVKLKNNNTRDVTIDVTKHYLITATCLVNDSYERTGWWFVDCGDLSEKHIVGNDGGSYALASKKDDTTIELKGTAGSTGNPTQFVVYQLD